MSENKKLTPKRRFKEFQNAGDWEQCKLGEIADIIGGGTPSTNIYEYWDGDIDWYAPAEIGEQIYANGSVRRITELGLKMSSAMILPANRTVLFTSRAGIGKTAILSRAGATNQGFQSFVLKDGYNPYFVYSMSGIITKKAESVASGSTFLEISGKMLEKLEVMIPNKAERDAIADYFEYIDHIIALHQRKLEKMKALKAAYLSEMFPAEGERKPKRRFKGFTDNWELRKLIECNTYFTDGNYGESYPKPEDMTDSCNGVPFLTGKNLKNGRLDITNVSYITKEKHSKLLSGHLVEDDIIIAVRGSLGALGYVNKRNSGWNINSQLAILRTDKKILRGDFLIQYLLSGVGQNDLLSRMTGSALKQLPLRQIKDLEVPIPNINEQDRILQYFNKIDTLITLHHQTLEKLQNIKKAYLNEMFIEGE